MTRILPHPILSLGLALVWAALWADWSAGTLVFGLLAGIALPLLVRNPAPALNSKRQCGTSNPM